MSNEAIVLTRFKGSSGSCTVGVGVTDAAGRRIKPSKVTAEIVLKQALEMFEAVLTKYGVRVNKAFKVPLVQHEFDAPVSFDYNAGAIYRDYHQTSQYRRQGRVSEIASPMRQYEWKDNSGLCEPPYGLPIWNY